MAKSSAELLGDALRADDSYAWSWHCNIAVCFMDEGGGHTQSNLAAARFMKTAFGVDVKKFPQWKAAFPEAGA